MQIRSKKFLSDNNLKPAAIVNTHGHFDHIGGVAELIGEYKIPFLYACR